VYPYFRYSVIALVFLISLSPALGEDCGKSIIKKLTAELGMPVTDIPAQLKKLDGISTVNFLGKGDSNFGGVSYLVTFNSGQKKVFKIYHKVNRGSMDLAAMKRLRFDQENGKNLGFIIPTFKQRRDLGPQVVEIDHVAGTSLDKILDEKNVDAKLKERLSRNYEQKVKTFLAHLQANYDVKFYMNDYPIALEVSSDQLTTHLEILIKHDNIIVTPNEEMYFVDPY
jgi:hypothetical protein